jgi:ribosomal protein S18 acetylase RimI-like enzyme
MSVQLVPMPPERLGPWIAAANAEHLRSRLRSGESRAEVEKAAARSLSELFPGGKPHPTHHIFDVVDGETVVGVLWIGPRADDDTEWWVWDVEIAEEHRRRGFAREALLLGNDEARRLGATAIGLNVFGYNTGARDLYESLGFEVTATQMRKTLA